MSTIPSGEEALFTALNRASQELGTMSDCIGRLQHTLSDTISEMSLDLYREIQSLDYVQQHLDELRLYIDAVGAMSDTNWTIDIAHATLELRLDQMVKRLRGAAGSTTGPHDEAGELQLLSAQES